ncbi:MAG: cytochrome c biogenesis protein CcsA, partial [Acidimicrobiia bacterium]
MNAGVIGPAAIWVAIVLAVVAVVTGRRRWLSWSAAIALLSAAVLGWALLSHDFSLEYVARTTSLATPWPYRLAALWGGMDGSMLVYAALSLSLAAVGLSSSVAIRVGAGVGLGLLGITVFFANPFVVPDLPAVDGDGLLAILQHPAMIYHPPILYLGLTALVVPFAKTVGLVVGDEQRSTWIRSTRRWLYISWTLLIVGMAAGGNWAYVELGWGGFWAWDPVENTSLMPWLAATVFLHTSRLEEARGRMRRWNVLFAALPFALTVLGVYLTRSGVTGSVHSFAEDPLVGRILIVAAGVMAIVVVWLALRSQPGEPWGGWRLDRNWWLAGNAVLLSAALVFVTVGSAFPAVSSVFFGDSVVVDSRFFVMTVLPIAVLVAVGIALSLRLSVREYVVVAVVVGTAVLMVGGARLGVVLLVPASASLLVIGAHGLRRGRRSPVLTATLAHLGFAMILVGVAGSSFGEDFSGSMMAGDTVEVGGHDITLFELTSGETERYLYARGRFEVDGSELTPEIRAYEDQPVPVAEPALRSTVRDDVIVAVSLLFPDRQTMAVSVFVRPLV